MLLRASCTPYDTCWAAQGVLDSFLIEITSLILPTKDKMGDGFLVDKILDKTGMKGTGASHARAGLPARQLSSALHRSEVRMYGRSKVDLMETTPLTPSPTVWRAGHTQ